jgi:hypothetical protein
MNAVLSFMKERVRKAVERDRRVEGRVEAISRVLWRWREQRLVILVALLALLDYTTTGIALELTDKGYVEDGLIASWALRVGGFGWLFVIDMGAVIILSLAAFTARYFLVKSGFEGYGRATFVVLLLPYAVMAAAAAINNLVLTFL